MKKDANQQQGLNGFMYGNNIVFTQNQQSADKIAKQKGWVKE